MSGSAVTGTLALVLAAAVSVSAAGCGPRRAAASTSKAGGETKAAAEGFAPGWKGWARINDAPFVSKGHGGTAFVVNVYVNELGAAAYRGRKGPYPVGTVIVKEHFANKDGTPGDLGPLMSMEKRPAGYNPEAGDWEYTKARPDGIVETRGKESMCSGCHADAAASNPDADHVYGVP
jgi:hypothetical protein